MNLPRDLEPFLGGLPGRRICHKRKPAAAADTIPVLGLRLRWPSSHSCIVDHCWHCGNSGGTADVRPSSARSFAVHRLNNRLICLLCLFSLSPCHCTTFQHCYNLPASAAACPPPRMSFRRTGISPLGDFSTHQEEILTVAFLEEGSALRSSECQFT